MRGEESFGGGAGEEIRKKNMFKQEEGEENI